MNDYIVISRVAGHYYWVRVQATSALAAEHALLDLSVCGYHGRYGVESAQAFSASEQDTDTFAAMSRRAHGTSMDVLAELIKICNAQIIREDRREDELRRVVA